MSVDESPEICSVQSSEKDDEIISESPEDIDCLDVQMNLKGPWLEEIIDHISQATQDKLKFTLHTLNVIVSHIIFVTFPQHFYLWYTLICVPILYLNYHRYRKHRTIFFLDFCYYVNGLTLIYLWTPQFLVGTYIRGTLFTICFSLATGPVLCSGFLWGDSLVPHLNEKMCTLILHFYPALTLIGIRWYSTPSQKFPICGLSSFMACSPTDLEQLLWFPVVAYLMWQIIVIIVIAMLTCKKANRHTIMKAYDDMVKRNNNPLFDLEMIFELLGPIWRKPLWIVWQMIYTIALINTAYYSYFFKWLLIGAVISTFVYTTYNGGSFYIDVMKGKDENTNHEQITNTSH